METKKLYYEDSHLQMFTANVLSCREAKGGWEVILDATAFYPTGGGQECDLGCLGSARVLDVKERDGQVVHLCDAPLAGCVEGKLDWARRFDHMQQHSGEHIVSGMLCSAYNCDNVGFHLGAETVIIDYNAELTWEQVLAVENRANQYLWENHPFVVTYPSAEELAQLDYRSKKELTGSVRITSFPDADMCACCGTHVAHSGEVGLVKFLPARNSAAVCAWSCCAASALWSI